MCSIAGIIDINHRGSVPFLEKRLEVMNGLLKHRGPDGNGWWANSKQTVGLAHTRLSIIDLSSGQQPMHCMSGNAITYNGEIYNYKEIRRNLEAEYTFKSNSDTEVILAAYLKWGERCVDHLRGMFAFALWDEKNQSLFCARDRFGIKPFYFYQNKSAFYFASETKALLPFLDSVAIDRAGLKDYLAFQFCLGSKTLFDGVTELPPAHTLTIKKGAIVTKKYWEVYYNIDYYHTEKHFVERLRELLFDSINVHMVSDVPVGAYISGGLDSSSIAAIAAKGNHFEQRFMGFTGKFARYGSEFDESMYARAVASDSKIDLIEQDMDFRDFAENIRNVIFHLDFPVAGPGSFPQYMISKRAAQDRKVVLGGQGGDEIFGGYARYLVAYFEQCIKGAIEGTLGNGNFVVTYESIIPNLVSLKGYKPMLRDFFRQGMFDAIDKRYFDLINRAPTLANEIHWANLGDYSPYESFRKVFYGENVGKEAYFDSMTHFDFKTLLPALLQVEDRMSMAHGLESRVPLLDHKIVEFAATIPADIKFKNGTLKRVYGMAVDEFLPRIVTDRKNKMGFPVPITGWFQNELKDFVNEVFQTQKERKREYFNSDAIIKGANEESQFGRKLWGLLSLELWCQEFIDKGNEYRKLLKN